MQTARLCRVIAVATVAALSLVAGIVPAFASTTPTFSGECVFGAPSQVEPPLAPAQPLQVAFTPAVTASGTSPINLSITGQGSCIGSTLLRTVTISLSDYGLLTCSGGEGPLQGSISWSQAPPSPQDVYLAAYVAGPASLLIVMVGSPDFYAVANLAWSSPAAVAACPFGGTSGTTLAGTMEYASS
jgi:hypothetical protein